MDQRYADPAGLSRAEEKKREKGEVQQYPCKVSAYSRQQMTRLIKQHCRTGHLCQTSKARARNGFKKRYTPQDVALLAAVDKLHHTLSGTSLSITSDISVPTKTSALQQKHRPPNTKSYTCPSLARIICVFTGFSCKTANYNNLS